MMIVAQALFSAVLFCLPFLLLVPLRRKSNVLLYLLFPIFGAIPALVGALTLFEPLEALLDRQGWGEHANLLIPAAGAVLPFLFMLVMAAAGGSLGRMFKRLSGQNRAQGWAAISVWSLLGAIWGGLWRLSGWLLGQ